MMKFMPLAFQHIMQKLFERVEMQAAIKRDWI